MKLARLFCALYLLLPATASPSVTDTHKLGAGLMIGSLTALTGKYWLSKNGALDFGLGFSGGNAIYVDYLWHIPGLFGSGTRFGRETSGYFGGGGGLGFWSDSYDCGRFDCSRRSSRSGTGVFLRGLVGFEWYPAPTQFGVFAEAGPTLLISPSTVSHLELSVGGRYYF